MDRKLINPLIVTGIADAVRAKGKTTEPIKVADLPEAIMNLPEGGGVGEDTSALLDAIGVESREDTGMANGLAIALTDAPLESSWSGERTTADGAPIKDGIAFVEKLKGLTIKDGENLQSFAPNAVVSKGRNMIDQDDFFGAVPNWTKDSEGVWSGNIAYLNQKYNDWDKYYPLHCKGRVMVSFVCKTDLTVATKTIYWQFFYDDGTKGSISQQTSNTYARYAQTSSANKTLVGFAISYGNNGMFYIKDLQIEMGDVATDYTPYIAPSRLDFDLTTIVDAQGNALFPDGELRSAGSVCDMVDYANGVAVSGKKVIGRVNLGMLNPYSVVASSGLFAINIPDIYDSRYLPTTYVPKLICSDSKYIISSQSVWTRNDYQISGNNNATHSILVKNKDCTNIQAMKTALQGVYLDYELATPIEGEAPLTKSFYPVQSNGSEEAITDNIVPFNGDIRYRVDTESLLTQSASLLRYSNEVTGANDSSLGNAVKTLTDSYK